MEGIKSNSAVLTNESMYQKTIYTLFKNFKIGQLRLTLPDGKSIFFGNGNGVKADIAVNNKRFFKRCVLYSDIGFGESYCDGDWSTNDLGKVIEWFIVNVESSGVMSGSVFKSISVNLLGRINKLAHYFNRNTKEKSLDNISYHYDLSNDFYKLMLDETMSYSSALFESNDETLHQAQVNKLKKLCEDLDIQAGDHILEIGCGWGGFAIYAASNYDCRVTGVTLSKEQLEYAQNKVKSLGLENKINLMLMDYRDLEGQFDKIVSVEMIEAVGHDFIHTYFETIERLLNESGIAVIQSITCPDSRYEEYRKGVDFIQKHIFPGGLLPSVGQIVKSCSETRFHIHNLRDIGLSYAKTLNIWDKKVMACKKQIADLGFDEAFFRKWHYYLKYCEAAFNQRNISTVQLVLIKPNNTKYKMELA